MKYTRKQLDHLERVPEFFAEKWRKEKGEHPFDNERRYYTHRAKLRTCISAVGVFGFVGVVVSIFWLTFKTKGHLETHVYLDNSIYLMAALFVSASAMIWGICKQPVESDTDSRWHFARFYEHVQRLYSEFNINESLLIPLMSEEEFRSSIEEALRSQATIVAPLKGFRHAEALARFQSMHRAALAWGLCHDNWHPYFQKQRVSALEAR